MRETLKINLKLNILFLIKFYKGIENEKYSSRKFLAPIINNDVDEHPISIPGFFEIPDGWKFSKTEIIPGPIF